jgi:hypothetical protein
MDGGGSGHLQRVARCALCLSHHDSLAIRITHSETLCSACNNSAITLTLAGAIPVSDDELSIAITNMASICFSDEKTLSLAHEETIGVTHEKTFRVTHAKAFSVTDTLTHCFTRL